MAAPQVEEDWRKMARKKLARDPLKILPTASGGVVHAHVGNRTSTVRKSKDPEDLQNSRSSNRQHDLGKTFQKCPHVRARSNKMDPPEN